VDGLQGSIVASDGENHFYTGSGEAWGFSYTGWERDWPQNDLPVPVGEVKLVGKDHLVTVDDVGWYFTSGWIEVGPFPGGPVSQEARSWGSTKGRFR
jgi:hypothetical protein